LIPEADSPGGMLELFPERIKIKKELKSTEKSRKVSHVKVREIVK
jgi:hypothetical protein